MKPSKTILISLLLVTTLLPCKAQQEEPKRRLLHFYFENGNTEWVTKGIIKHIADSLKSAAIDSISVHGYASPAGIGSLNTTLADARARSVADSVRCFFPFAKIVAKGHGEDWSTLITKLNQYDRKDFQKAIRIIKSTPEFIKDSNGKIIDGRKHQLKMQNYGRTYIYMAENIFPVLRRTDVYIYYKSLVNNSKNEKIEAKLTKEESSTIDEIIDSEKKTILFNQEENNNTRKLNGCECKDDTDNKVKETKDTVYIYLPPRDNGTIYSRTEESLKKAFLGLRTNLLVPLTNFGVDIPLGKHFTVGFDYYFPWFWADRKNKHCFQFQGIKLDAKYWFGQKDIVGYTGNTFTGHSIGLAAFAGRYDIERNYTGHQGEIYGAELQYAYSFLLKDWLRLDLGIGFGYARLPSRKYRVYESGGKLIRDLPYDKNFDWFGPTNLSVSLIFPLYYNYKPSASHE